MMRSVKLVPLLLPAVLLFAMVAAQPKGDGEEAAPPEPAVEGVIAVYSEAQAQRGAELYRQNCRRCHRDDLLSNDPFPPITGPRFFAKWEGRSAKELFDFVRTNMPLGAGESLAPEVYADIFAFWLQFNGFPAGEQELGLEGEGLEQIILRLPTEEPEEP